MDLRPHTPIARKLLKAVLALGALLTLFFTGIQAWYDYRQGLRAVAERFEEINRTHSPGLSAALWAFDRQTMISQIDGISHFPYVRFVEIRGKGDLAASAGTRVTANLFSRDYPLSHLYNDRMVQVGTLHLEADTSEVLDGVFRNVAKIFLVQFLTIALVSIFLLLMFNRLITRHIVRAAGHFRAFEVEGAGSPLVLDKQRAGDELDILGDAFNTLQEKLRTTYRDLRESEQRFKTLFEQVAVGVSEVETKTGRFVTANARYAQILGVGAEELVARTTRDFTHPDDLEAEAANMRLLVGGLVKEFCMEKRFIRRGGAVIWVNLSVTPKWQPGEEPWHHISVVEDITDRKRAEEELRLQSQRLRLATSAAKLGIWDWNIRDDALVWDERMRELYGVAGAMPVSFAAWRERLHREDRERVVAECEAALRGEKEFDTVFRICRPDGDVLHIKANGLVIRGGDGRGVRMIGINADISEGVRAEEARKEFETQLQQSQRMESVGRLAGGVAHDFNNMLGVILGRAELGLRHVSPDSPACGSIKEIIKTAERSADLTRQLLAFARQQTVSPKVLDLNENVAVMLKMLQRLIGEDIHLVWQPAPDLWKVRVDPSQIDQILANLCVNARDSITDTGHITIKTENCVIEGEYCSGQADAVPGEYVRLTVSDDGSGMDRETQARVFEPFFTTKEVGRGTGLGLATVYGAVRQNNGFINIYSEPGMGTIFSIYLPRHAGEADAPPKEAPAPVPRGAETILLVEDEPAILEVAGEMLREQGYAVLAANGPEQAIQLARENSGNIHLLVTDVVMPKMNGRDLAERLLPANPKMKRLFMSGYTADVIGHHGVLNEGVSFIQKPFTLQALGTKVREVLDGDPHRLRR